MGKLVTMRIIGIDPGIAITGFGIIEIVNNKPKAVGYGAIKTPANHKASERLLMIQSNLKTILSSYKPTICGIEKLFFSKNVKTAMQVSEARGVILCCLEEHKIPYYEYSPTQIKLAIIGNGQAEKKQIQFMTKEILKLEEIPKPDDTADALAIAICHHHSHSLKSLV